MAAALFGRPLVGPTGGVRLDLVCRAMNDVDAAAVRLPSGDARSEVLVGISDAAVVLFLEFILDGVGSGVAAQPELLDELLALLVGAELEEGLPLFVGDDVQDVFLEPLLIRGVQLFEKLPVALLLLLRDRHRPLALLSRLGLWRGSLPAGNSEREQQKKRDYGPFPGNHRRPPFPSQDATILLVLGCQINSPCCTGLSQPSPPVALL